MENKLILVLLLLTIATTYNCYSQIYTPKIYCENCNSQEIYDMLYRSTKETIVTVKKGTDVSAINSVYAIKLLLKTLEEKQKDELKLNLRENIINDILECLDYQGNIILGYEVKFKENIKRLKNYR